MGKMVEEKERIYVYILMQDEWFGPPISLFAMFHVRQDDADEGFEL